MSFEKSFMGTLYLNEDVTVTSCKSCEVTFYVFTMSLVKDTLG
jgi:hypothetical protein